MGRNKQNGGVTGTHNSKVGSPSRTSRLNFIHPPTRRPLRSRTAKLAAGALIAMSIGVEMFAAAPALAYGYPTTVRAFCTFNRYLGRPTFGVANGDDYAAWSLGTRYFPYFAVDTTGDTRVDLVVYAPLVGGVQTARYYGLCTGPNRDRWYSAAALERQLAAQQARAERGSNAYWSEVGPQMEFDMDMEAITDWEM